MVILTFRLIQCLHLMYAEIAWLLVPWGTQVQPQVIIDPDYLPDYLSVSYDYDIIGNIINPNRVSPTKLTATFLTGSFKLRGRWIAFKKSHLSIDRHFKRICQRIYILGTGLNVHNLLNCCRALDKVDLCLFKFSLFIAKFPRFLKIFITFYVNFRVIDCS